MPGVDSWDSAWKITDMLISDISLSFPYRGGYSMGPEGRIANCFENVTNSFVLFIITNPSARKGYDTRSIF